jgi:hypothetical protein
MSVVKQFPADEWYGEPHTITVYQVRPPEGPFGSGSLGDYDLQHPSSCEQEEHHHGYMRYTCAVSGEEENIGLASSLRYSGTPITGPGTYRIQAWGRKTYYYWAGYEYDHGVGVMEPEKAGQRHG